ncbi:MAG: hypothetical protein LBT62_08475 [Deltaproteobacteria bacterium]|jgi:hypothetical protein|nr:hypothetical protein [Deltaproteobacteria bacterium]
MDLGAFLRPGFYPVFFLDDEGKKEPWGQVLKRPERPISWLAAKPLAADSTVILALDVPGFSLGPEGELSEDQFLVASIVLKATVRSSRLLNKDGAHVLRFSNLIRLLD